MARLQVDHRGATRRCYLCLNPIETSPSRDHVPSRMFFGSELRKSGGLQLATLDTHAGCNREYSADEEYFRTAMHAFAHDTAAGRAVRADLARGLAENHGVGLYHMVKEGFGRVETAEGMIIFQYDGRRVQRVLRKLVRGLYTLQTGRLLPDSVVGRVLLVPPSQASLLVEPAIQALLATPSLMRYSAVFDMKAICQVEGAVRAHFQAFLIWDRLVALALFHDPSCRCANCDDVGAVPRRTSPGLA